MVSVSQPGAVHFVTIGMIRCYPLDGSRIPSGGRALTRRGFSTLGRPSVKPRSLTPRLPLESSQVGDMTSSTTSVAAEV